MKTKNRDQSLSDSRDLDGSYDQLTDIKNVHLVESLYEIRSKPVDHFKHGMHEMRRICAAFRRMECKRSHVQKKAMRESK
ncbi:hypothetical protein Baya_9650 [Bagarius yarrelli]|uniref:Uncharacterized protein n=1 Tax=Bagarius yarrelli TaxID=175774 RepID=A0A556UXT2_BAGYA|nr:hypothetical protein Baya_9650 [Bagarius yarrelli]